MPPQHIPELEEEEEEEEEEEAAARTTTTTTEAAAAAAAAEAAPRRAAGIAPARPISEPAAAAAPISRITLFFYLVLVFLAFPLSAPQLLFKLLVKVYLSPFWLSTFAVASRRRLRWIFTRSMPPSTINGRPWDWRRDYWRVPHRSLHWFFWFSYSCFLLLYLPYVFVFGGVLCLSLVAGFKYLGDSYLPTIGHMLHKYFGPLYLRSEEEEEKEEDEASLGPEATLEQRVDSILAHRPTYQEEIANGTFAITQPFDFTNYSGVGALTSSMEKIKKEREMQEYEETELAAMAAEDPTLAWQPLWFPWGLLGWCLTCYGMYAVYRLWDREGRGVIGRWMRWLEPQAISPPLVR